MERSILGICFLLILHGQKTRPSQVCRSFPTLLKFTPNIALCHFVVCSSSICGMYASAVCQSSRNASLASSLSRSSCSAHSVGTTWFPRARSSVCGVSLILPIISFSFSFCLNCPALRRCLPEAGACLGDLPRKQKPPRIQPVGAAELSSCGPLGDFFSIRTRFRHRLGLGLRCGRRGCGR